MIRDINLQKKRDRESTFGIQIYLFYALGFVLYCLFIFKLLHPLSSMRLIVRPLVLVLTTKLFYVLHVAVFFYTFYSCIAKCILCEKATCIMQHFVNVRILLLKYTIVVYHLKVGLFELIFLLCFDILWYCFLQRLCTTNFY